MQRRQGERKYGSRTVGYHRCRVWAAMRLAATLDAQSKSPSDGGVGHLDTGLVSLTGFLEMSMGLLGVAYADCPKPTLLRFDDGEGVR